MVERVRTDYRIENLASPVIALVRNKLFAGESPTILRKIKRKIKKALGSPVPDPTPSDGRIFVPIYQLFCRPGTYSDTVLGWRGTFHPMFHQDLVAGKSIDLTLVPRGKGILGTHIFLGTHGRRNSCTVQVDLIAHEISPVGTAIERIVSSGRKSCEDFLDNELNYIPFPEIINESAPVFTVRISSPDAAQGNCVAVWGSLIAPSELKRSTDGRYDCTDFLERSEESTRYLGAPRAETFIPRFTASCYENSYSESVIGWIGPCLDSRYSPLYPGSSTELTFQCHRNFLAKVVTSVVTFGRDNHCTVIMKLSRLEADSWKLLLKEEFESKELHEGEPFEWSFEPLVDSEGKWFKVEIESPDANPALCLAIRGTVLVNGTDVFRSLPRNGDTLSMVDTRLCHPNPEVVEGALPRLERVKEMPQLSEFKTLVVISDTTSEEVLAKLSTLPRSTIVTLNQLIRQIDLIDRQHLIVFAQVPGCAKAETALIVARQCMVPTLALGYTPAFRSNLRLVTELSHDRTSRLPSFAVQELTDYDFSEIAPAGLPEALDQAALYSAYTGIRPSFVAQRLPSITVISILYRKEAEISTVLDSIARQNYPGAIEIILVDDCSPDSSSAAVKSKIVESPGLFGPGGRMPITLLQNERNIGNCGSRNRAIEAARSDLVLIIDADCVLNENCLKAHAAAHGVGDVDVVIGTHNLETNHRDAFQVLKEFETDTLKTQLTAQLQDPTVPQSFLNCITRNVSIRRSFIDGPLFDDNFSYSASPDSGFGWEDVEMGYRLYQRGARIRFDNRAISVHLTHPSSCAEDTKPARSIRNFRRLIEKHPELTRVSRRWVLDTFGKICQWMDNSGTGPNGDREWLEHQLRGTDSLRAVYQPRRPLRILSFRWHCPHQYEIYKLPHKFTLMKTAIQEYSRSWGYEQRPLPPNVTMKELQRLNLQEFDMAILHFDENSLYPENTNGTLGHEWGKNFQWMRDNLNIPMAAICHGTPQFRGQYQPDYSKADLGTRLDFEHQALVDYIGDIPVVCNSYQAQAEWRFNNSRVIWHGFDPMEFGPAPDGHGILSLGSAMAERPLYRGHYLYQEVCRLLPPDIKPSSLKVPRPPVDYHGANNHFAYAKFRLYNQAIRKHSIYFNPTGRSPMPRSRGESMMSGLVSVSADNHDVSLFIKNGINGFYSDDPREIADYLTFLMRNEKACREMGRRSRALASDVFNIDRFHRDWIELISDLGV